MTEKKEAAVETAAEVKKETKAKAPKKEASGSKVQEIIETVKSLTVMELSELVKALETEFGVTAVAPVMAAAPAAVAAAAAPAVEEKTEFDVILNNFGNNKIQVIKVVRALTALGLKEAKDLVDGVPKPVKEGISKDEANKIKKELEDAGAAVEIK